MPKISETIQLSKFGWTGYTIPTNLESIFTHLPKWQQLPLLRPPETYDEMLLRFPWRSFRDESNVRFLPALEIGEKIDSGTYGKIHVSKRSIYYPKSGQSHLYSRTTPFEEIISKVIPIELTESEKHAPRLIQQKAYEEEIQALIYESTLHILVREVFSKKGFPDAVPKLYEILGFSNSPNPKSAMDISGVVMNMEFIRGWTMFDYLKKYFAIPHTPEKTERMIIDILIQLCVYLDILQTDLKFNHRDLKINNVLFRKKIVLDSIHHSSLSQPWRCRKNIAILDFGFSCIACDSPSKRSLLQAGSWFTMRHDCMKKGRDIALFLYSLEAFYPLQTKISASFYALLRQAVTATQLGGGGDAVCLWDGVTEKGQPIIEPTPLTFTNGIYKFLRFSDVEIPGCEPKVLLPILEAYAETHNLKN